MSQSGISRVRDQILPPDVPTSFVTNSGTAIPAANILNELGSVIAAGTNPFRSIGSGNTVTYQAQISQAIASTDATKIGLSAFDSSVFSVDANGFVSLTSSGATEHLTGNTGGQLNPTANNFNILTANATVKFAGSGSTLTEDFGITNLVLGSSLPALTSGTTNVGVGSGVLASVTSSSLNTIVGYHAGRSINTGTNNTGVGAVALELVTTSPANVAIGSTALTTLATGNGYNTAVGFGSLPSLTTGGYNIAIGNGTATAYTSSESSNICIGSVGVLGESNVMRLGSQIASDHQVIQTYLAGVLNMLSGFVMPVTTPGAYPYTTLITDQVILVDTSSARTIVPLANPVTGTRYVIKDSVGSAPANNITITPSGKNVDGSASTIINVAYGSVTLVYGTSEWHIV